MMRLAEVWHFHRPALAKVYLDTLNAGLVTSTTIFAPQRAGKTSFMLKDLTPAALQLGYTVAYADLWDEKVQTELALQIDVLIEALSRKAPLNHEGAWAALDATEKALVRMLADDASLKPFSRDVLGRLRDSIGVDTLAVTHVQRAMSKLSNIVVKSPRDTYEFENEAFAQWVRNLAE